MKPRLIRLLACIGLAAMLSSCPETTVGPDFGIQAAALKAEDWNGLYEVAGDDDVFNVEVTDVAKGQLTLTEVPAADQKDKSKPLLLTLRRASLDKDDADLYFATLIEKGDKAENLPLYLVETKGKEEILLWGVNQKAVETCIKAGTLKGTLKVPDKDGPHCHLESDPANYAQLVQPQFWKWREPAALVRQKKPR
jgi:hypothetical protein